MEGSCGERAQIVRPRQVMDGLLNSVVMVRSYMIAIIAIASLVTLLLMILIIVLSIRLRRAEIVTMTKTGSLGSHMGMIRQFPHRDP